MTQAPMKPLLIAGTRSGLIESEHRVSVAVCDENGRLVAQAGDPQRLAFWRSAAKPFQSMPLVTSGALEAFQFSDAMLALACASHSSEKLHLTLCREMLRRIDCEDQLLACGAHPLTMPTLEEEERKQGERLTPVWSNCSGKHTGMLAVCKQKGWRLEGYEKAEHPLQQEILSIVSEWTGLSEKDIHLGVDGCTAVCFALPLTAMATAYARLGNSERNEAVKIREAMLSYPQVVAGTGRLCSELMEAMQGEVLAKVGAEGIYCASLPQKKWGVALKVESGDARANRVALLDVLRQLGVSWPAEKLNHHAHLPIFNTRHQRVGEWRPSGELQFLR